MDWSLKRIIQKTRLLTRTENACDLYYGNHVKRIYSKRTAGIRHAIKKLGFIPFDRLQFLGDDAEKKESYYDGLLKTLQYFHGYSFGQILSTIAAIDTIKTLWDEYEHTTVHSYCVSDYPLSIEIHTRASQTREAEVITFTDVKPFFDSFLNGRVLPAKVIRIGVIYGNANYNLRLTAKPSNFDSVFSEEAYDLKEFKRLQKDMSNPIDLNLFFWCALKGSL